MSRRETREGPDVAAGVRAGSPRAPSGPEAEIRRRAAESGATDEELRLALALATVLESSRESRAVGDA